MSFNILLKATFVFLSFSFSAIILPMDLPIVVKKKFSLPNNAKIKEKKEKFGEFLGSLPTEVLTDFFICSTPGMKNGLRKTNIFFSELFSWEKVHPFILHKRLIAHEKDIQSLIIRCMHKQDKAECECDFIQAYQNEFFSYEMLGEARFFVLEYDNEKKPDMYLFNHGPKKRETIHPFLETCLMRDSTIIEKYLRRLDYKMFSAKNVSRFPMEVFHTAIQILVQNHDVSSLELVLNSKLIGKKYTDAAVIPVCFKLICAAIVSGSYKTLPFLIRYYKCKNISARSTGQIYQEEDWISRMLEKNLALMGQPLKKDCFGNIIKSNYPALKSKFKDDEYSLNASLRLLLTQSMLEDLGIIEKTQSKKKSHNICLVM